MKNILFFSQYWPNFDENSGGKRMYEMLKILSSKYTVYFIVTDSYHSKKYSNALQALGINVFYRKQPISPICIYTPDTSGSKLFNGLPLCDAKKDIYNYLLGLKNIQFDFCFFSVYISSVNYSHIVKKVFPGIKTIVDSVDICWLREDRGGVGSPDKKELEKNTYKSCDTLIAVSNFDREILENECQLQNIKVISNIHQEKIKNPPCGEDILFIGGFYHEPNIVAAIRSCSLYRQFIAESKIKCKLYIIGSYPPDRIQSLAGNGVVVVGNISDSEMTKYFKKAKVLIAPLTYGSGIKGKICESIMHKVPVITNSIGIEGFDFNNYEEYFHAETDREFIGALNNVYNLDRRTIKKITNKAFQKTKQMFSANSVGSTLNYILNPNPHVVVSIITYKNQKILEQCLESLINCTTYKNLTIVVTDNAAEESTKNVVIKFIQDNIDLDIRYYENKRNQFFSKPNNNVIKEFNKSDIILLNDDTIIKTKGWIEILQNAVYTSGDIACGGGKSVTPENTISEAGSCIYNDGSAQNIGYGSKIDLEKYNKKLFVNYCSGSLLYLKRDAINNIGTLDEDFKPLYYEDVDWQIRGHIIGYKTIYEPKCVYEHKLSATVSKMFDKHSYLEIARNIFVQKYLGYDIEQYNHENKWNTDSEWIKYNV